MIFNPPGLVSLVGAGPGDPDLLTLKALRRLQSADVVVYDALVHPDMLEHCRHEAELIFVGKRSGHHTLPQEQINALLVELGRAGRRVVRLKGGDPFVFGRGGEEAEALMAAGVPWEYVPGISSAVAVPGYAGIPLTHRNLARSFAVMTGHEALDSSQPLDYHHGRSADTLVILMGLERLRLITERLIASGRAAETPAAVISCGTTVDQRTIIGSLASIADAVEAEAIAAPAVIVVGEVVRYTERLHWFRSDSRIDARQIVSLEQLLAQVEA